jgi:hypothetical protein
MNTIEINNIIIYNDYNKLQHLLDNNILFIKNYDLLLCKSIEYKSLECFDILLNYIINNNISLDNFEASLNKSIDYIINNNNIQNKYYLNKLLEKNILINKEELIKASEDFILFKILFNKINNKNDILLLYLINNFIKNNKMNIIFYLYNFIIENNLISKNELYNFIFKLSIKYNNINSIIFLENNKYDMMYIINDNNIKIPSLYYSISFLYDDKKIIYKYLLNFYINYSKNNDINLIENINDIFNIVKIFSENIKYNSNFNYILNDIFKFKIKILNLDSIIKNCLIKIFSSEKETIITNICETIFILKINNLLNNDNILSLHDVIIPYININNNNNNINYNINNKKRINLYYILIYYKFILPENIEKYYIKILSDYFYNDNENDIKNNSEKYINQLLVKYNN